MSIVEETQRSIEAAVKAGVLDRRVSAGPIAAVLRLAELIDDPEFPFVAGKLDNVSLPTYLNFCARLRLVPAEPPKGAVPAKEGARGGKLANLRSIAGGKSS